MHVRPVPAPDEHPRLAGHRRMDGVLREMLAEKVVLRIRRHAADRVAGVNVFERKINPALLEKARDFVPQENADVLRALVAAGVNFLVAFHQFLPRTFGDHDDRALLLGDLVADRLQQPALALECKFHFRDQNEIHIPICERRIARDESRLAPHQPHDPDSIRRTERLGMGGTHDLHRFRKCRLESE